jgi:hypothetical protein
MAANGELIWKTRFSQLWKPQFAPGGKKMAAIGSVEFGRWTIVIDDKPWGQTFRDMVLEPVFSPDGNRAAAVVKDENRWSICADGKAWHQDFDMVWDPVFSADSAHVLARVEKDGKYHLAADGSLKMGGFEKFWDPVVEPDGNNLLLRYIEDGKYIREVKKVSDLLG